MPLTRIFFATDVHGSEECFTKFLNAGKFYKADVLILGGDITGKMIVPIVEQQDGTFMAHFSGIQHVVKTKEEIEGLKKTIRRTGCYPYLTNTKEMRELNADKVKVDELFSHLMVETLRRWTAIAERFLKDTEMRCYITGGNDDRTDVLGVLKDLKSEHVTDPEDKIVHLDDQHEMISCGCSNITPWNCPRDIPEEELLKRIEAIASQVENMKDCIFNFHCPPYDSGLDTAPELNKDFRPVIKAGEMRMIPVGSTAVRKSIEKYQPLLGLHGHIHEARGVRKIGRTFCVNPGSEYSEGILRGAIINLERDKVKGYLLTSG